MALRGHAAGGWSSGPLLPGLLADDSSTYALRSFLNSHGYAASGWELGRNFGMRANIEHDMLARIDELFEHYG